MQHDHHYKLTTSAAARAIGVAEATVRLMEQRGQLPATRTTSGVRLFARDDVDRVVRERAARRPHGDDEA